MRNNKIHILSTRPLSTQLINEAEKHSISIDAVPFIETSEIVNEKISDAIAKYQLKSLVAVFTSMNAFNAVAKRLNKPPEWKIYCIGNTTRELITDHFGKALIAGTASNANELADVMLRNGVGQVVFFCGDQRRNELPLKLKQHNVIVEEVVVYVTRKIPVLITKKYDGILFFSPSAVESFFSKNEADERTQLFAIGSTTAESIQQYSKNNVIVSASQVKDHMVRQVIEHYREDGKRENKR